VESRERLVVGFRLFDKLVEGRSEKLGQVGSSGNRESKSFVGNALKSRFEASRCPPSGGWGEAEKKRHERSQAGNCLRWRQMNLGEQKTRGGEQPEARLNTKPMASGFVWSKTSESRCSCVAACLQVSARRLNGKGGTSLMKTEGCTKWISP